MKDIAAVLEERLGMRLPAGVDLKPLARAAMSFERHAERGSRHEESVAARLARMPRVDLLRCSEYLLCHETYFFRHERHFDVLSALLPHVLQARAQEEAPRQLRILSAGCATGEEAYSLALWARTALSQHDGWSPRVAGVDRSEHALALARRGHYGDWSMRGNARSRMGDALAKASDEDGAVVVAPWLRSAVDFVAVDLNESVQVAALGPEDIILCRNVLMYMTLPSAQRALNALAEQLVPGGILLCENHDMVGLRVPSCLQEVELGGDVVLERPYPGRTRPQRGELASPKTGRRPLVSRERRRKRTLPAPKNAEISPMSEADAHFLRALEADLSNRVSEAELELRVAIAVNPELYVARLHLGQLLMRLGRHAEGVAIVRALRNRLKSAAAHHELIDRCTHVLALHTGEP